MISKFVKKPVGSVSLLAGVLFAIVMILPPRLTTSPGPRAWAPGTERARSCRS